MFRNFNIEEDVVVKVDLYKNRREKIAEIPLDYVEGITYKFNDIDEISISIPKYNILRGEMITNHIYSKIKTRQQLVVTTINKDGSEQRQRFVLHDKKVVGSKNKGTKSFVGYSWQKTLEKHRITVEQLSRQLTNKDDNVNVGEGILDLLCKKVKWNVGYVDPDARYKTSTAVKTYNENLYENFTTAGSITENGVIFDKKVNIPAKQDRPTYLTINYINLKTIYNDTSIANVNILNNLSSTPFYATITNIRAEHYSETGNRYGIKYIFTLDIPTTSNDKNTVEIIETFTNCINKSISCDKIYIGYDYAELEEVRNIQYATFEAFDDSAYKFLEDIGEVFDCVFSYDTINNIINVYAKENLKENNGYRLTLNRNIDEISISEDDNIITCLKVESSNASIAEENPNGTNIIENYDYYIRNNIMSDELQKTLKKYDALAEERQKAWLKAKNDKSIVQQRYTKAQSEARSLEERIKNLNFRLTQFITDKQANQLAEAKKEIDALESQYNTVIKKMSVYQNEINSLNDTMASISVSINKATATDENGNKLFTDEDIQELNDMIEVDTYNDSYFTTSYGLYNYCVKYLNEKIIPELSFSMTTQELKSHIKHIAGWNKIIKLGNLYTLDGDEMFKEFNVNEVRLVQYKLIPVENGKRFKLSDFSFSNKIKLQNTLKVGANIGRTTNKVDGAVTTFRDLWENSKVVNNFVGDMISSGLNIAAANIKGGVYRNILDFSEAGCFIINNTDGDKKNQIYLGGGTIAITENGWETSRVAIDKNGVISETLFGKILLGEKVVITSDDDLFYIGNGESEQQKNKEFGLYIYNKENANRVDRIFLGLTNESGVRKATLRLKDATGQQVVLSEDGIVQTSQFVCWDNVSPNYPMRIPYFCDSGVKQNRKIVLSMVFEKYRAFEKGTASGGKIQSSAAGGGGTSAAGGGGTSAAGGGGTSAAGGSTTVSGGGTTSKSGGSYSSTSEYTSEGINWTGFIDGKINTEAEINVNSPAFGKYHYHEIDPREIKHNHKVEVSIKIPGHTHDVPSHSHNIGSHTHSLPDHTHQIPDHTHQIPDHSHQIDTTHEHALKYGIFEEPSKCSNVKVYINNTVFAENINSDTELNITEKIKIGQRNDIRIETETNGRITCNLFTKSFAAF